MAEENEFEIADEEFCIEGEIVVEEDIDDGLAEAIEGLLEWMKN